MTDAICVVCRGLAFAALVLVSSPAAFAVCAGGPQVFTCLDENDYLNKLAEEGLGSFSEGFENSTTWGAVRTPSSAQSVTSRNIVWTANHPLPNAITTGLLGAYTGSYGVYDALHGSAEGIPSQCDIDEPPETCLFYDGFTGTRTAGAPPLYGVGGYIVGTFGSNIEIRAGANRYGLGKLPDTSHHFFGVIDTAGFSEFQFREIDGKVGQKFSIYGDHFIFGVVGGNNAPLADAGVDQTATVGDTVTLNGAGSSDPDGDPLDYQWTLTPPPGSAASLSNETVVDPTFVPDLAGTYAASLVVSDGALDSTPDVATVSVQSPPVNDAWAEQSGLVHWRRYPRRSLRRR